VLIRGWNTYNFLNLFSAPLRLCASCVKYVCLYFHHSSFVIDSSFWFFNSKFALMLCIKRVCFPTSTIHITSNAHVLFQKCRKNTNFYNFLPLFDNFLQKNAPFCAFFTSFLHQHAHMIAPKPHYKPKKPDSQYAIRHTQYEYFLCKTNPI